MAPSFPIAFICTSGTAFGIHAPQDWTAAMTWPSSASCNVESFAHDSRQISHLRIETLEVHLTAREELREIRRVIGRRLVCRSLGRGRKTKVDLLRSELQRKRVL